VNSASFTGRKDGTADVPVGRKSQGCEKGKKFLKKASRAAQGYDTEGADRGIDMGWF